LSSSLGAVGSSATRLRAAQSLQQLSAPEKKVALPVLLELLKNPQMGVRLAAAQTLLRAGPAGRV